MPIARRGAIKEAPVDVDKLNPLTPAAFVVDRGPPLLSPLGHRSARDRPGAARRPSRRRRSPGRQHDHPAARQDQLPVRRPNHQAQGAGSDHRLLARSLADQEGNPVALSVERLFRRRRLRPARGRSPLFQPRSGEPDARPVGDARRHGPGAVAPRPDPQSGRRPKAQPSLSSRRWRTPARSAGAGARDAPGRPGRATSKIPTGSYFADWVDAVRPGGAGPRLRRNQGPYHARFATFSGWRSAQSRARRSAMRRRRWSRCGRTGASSPWSAARAIANSPFNRVTQARRQPGSAFKLFVYLAAMRAGWTPDSIIEDKPITIDGWSPANSDRVYRGPITLREAFARSSNAATVRLEEEIGRNNVDPRRPRSRHHDAASQQSQPRAGHVGSQPSGADVRLCGGRRAAAIRSSPAACRKCRRSRASRPSSRSRGALDRRRDQAPMLDLSMPPPTTAPAAARHWSCRPSARRARPRKIATPSSSASPAIWWSACGSAATTTSRSARSAAAPLPAEIWHNFMTSALAVDGRAGPPLPPEFKVPQRQPQPRRPQEPAPRRLERQHQGPPRPRRRDRRSCSTTGERATCAEATD